jgi:sulfoxide reductase heme-binding subunit YedZ
MSWRIAGVVGLGLVVGVLLARATQDADTGTASWDALRAAGFASYLCLWLSVCTGIAVHMRYRPGPMALTWLLETHRIVSALGLSFLAGHLVGLLVDPTISFAAWDLALGFTSSYRPLQVTFGAAAMWMLVAVLGSTALANRMPYGAWRNLHYLSFPAYVLALVHGLTAGTDASSSLALGLYASTAAVAAALVAARLFGRGWVTATP